MTRKRVLFRGAVEVHYRFINVHGADEDLRYELGDEHRGQANGLCGAAVPGLLNLVTGLHTGDVDFTVERHAAEPAVDDVWEEVVEVSTVTTVRDMALHGFQSQYRFDLPPGAYRVRYCARGMQEAADRDEPLDHYLLQFWPGGAEPDRIVRQTTEFAAYRHRKRPRSALTAEDIAQRARRERAKQEREEAEYQELLDREW